MPITATILFYENKLTCTVVQEELIIQNSCGSLAALLVKQDQQSSESCSAGGLELALW